MLLSSSGRLRRADNRFRSVFGTPPAVISLGSFSYLRSLVPNVVLGAGTLRRALFEFGSTATLVCIDVANHGNHNVAFGGGCVAIRRKGSKDVYLMPQPMGQHLPHTLNHGTSMMLMPEFDALKPAMQEEVGNVKRAKVRAGIKDQLGRVHASKWHWFDVND